MCPMIFRTTPINSPKYIPLECWQMASEKCQRTGLKGCVCVLTCLLSNQSISLQVVVFGSRLQLRGRETQRGNRARAPHLPPLPALPCPTCRCFLGRLRGRGAPPFLPPLSPTPPAWAPHSRGLPHAPSARPCACVPGGGKASSRRSSRQSSSYWRCTDCSRTPTP